MTKAQARAYAVKRAEDAGLDPDTADAVANRAMGLWDPEYTKREWDMFIDQEIDLHAAP